MVKKLKYPSINIKLWNCLEQWPEQISSSFSQTSSMREAYLARHTALHKFKFSDPLVADFYTEPKPYNHLFLNTNEIIFSQCNLERHSSLVHMMRIDSFLSGKDFLVTLSDHHARITCVRTKQNVCNSITLPGNCQRCFRGHNGPVSTLSDKLLGDGSGKIFASGGVDATVRLWSLSSSGKRGQHALKATLYGHEKPVVLMSVAGHKTSLLVSISKNSKAFIVSHSLHKCPAKREESFNILAIKTLRCGCGDSQIVVIWLYSGGGRGGDAIHW
ncbi:hypothetical protein CsSME_00004284 [Camellia sinensis var. sinensis]